MAQPPRFVGAENPASGIGGDPSFFPSGRSDAVDPRVRNVGNKPRCRVQRNANLSIATTGAWQIVVFDAEIYDADAMFDVATAGTIVINTTGIWQFDFAVTWRNTAGGNRISALNFNNLTAGAVGSQIGRVESGNLAAYTYNYSQGLSVTHSCKKTDKIYPCVFQDSGGAVLLDSGDTQPWAARFSATLLSYT